MGRGVHSPNLLYSKREGSPSAALLIWWSLYREGPGREENGRNKKFPFICPMTLHLCCTGS